MSSDESGQIPGLPPPLEPFDTYDIEAASIYDSTYGDFDDDRQFWTRMRSDLLPQDAALVELGCGSGRITRWFVHDPHLRLICIDRSIPMLEGLPRSRSGHLDTIAADISAIPLRDEIADLVIAPFSVFNYLTTVPLMLAAVKESKRIARPGASVIIDFAYHDLALLQPGQQRSTPRVERNTNPPSVDWWDWQVGSVWNSADYHEYRAQYSGNDVRVVELIHRWHLYTLTEVLLLLEHAGLVPIRFFGDYDCGPLEPESPRLIALSRRPN